MTRRFSEPEKVEMWTHSTAVKRLEASLGVWVEHTGRSERSWWPTPGGPRPSGGEFGAAAVIGGTLRCGDQRQESHAVPSNARRVRCPDADARLGDAESVNPRVLAR